MNVKRRSIPQTAGAYPGFLSMKQAEEYWYSPLDGMLILRRVTPPPRPQQYVADAVVPFVNGRCHFYDTYRTFFTCY